MMHLAVAALLALAQNNDKAQANSYDDGWKSGWKTHCTTVLSGGTGKVDGFVLHIGDSITYSSAYGAWMNYGAGKTAEDTAITDNWINNFAVPGGIDATSTRGLYLANKDIPGGNRAFTAAGGIATDEYISGNNNGGPAMPATMNVGTAQGYTASSTYTGNLQIQTVAYAFSAAQFAVVMLGTNDCSAGRTDTAFIADLQTIVTTLEGNHIAVVLSTIPPHSSNNTLAQQYNTQIRSYASSHGLPLIDFYAEILARQPVNYASTLMVAGDVHPSGDRAGYTVGSDPYANGGDPATHKTGAAAAEVGYLLRSWLSAQKLKEVRSFVVQGNPAVPAISAPAPPGPAAPAAPSAPKNNGGGGGGCGGSVGGPVSPWTLLGSALAALVLLRATRKTGF
jgi:lysophospholipase L1-like esterase